MAHPRLVVGGSLLLALVLAAGAAVALTSATNDKGSSRAPAPLSTLASSAPVETPTEAPTVTPTVAPTTSPTPGPVATVTAAPTATTTAKATGSPAAVKHYPYPKPTRSYTPLYLAEVGYDPDGDSGHTAPYLKSHAIDGDGTIRLGQINWGDGTVTQGPAAPAACGPRPSPTTRPGPYQPHGDDVTLVNDHTYKKDGDYTISVTVSSGNADCRPNGPAPESATLSLMVHIGPS